MTTHTFQSIRICLWRVIRWTAGDAVMGALCGGLFGMIYGGFETLVYGDAWRIVSAAGYLALAGGIAGAVLGSFAAFLEGIADTATDPMSTHESLAKSTGTPGTAREAERFVRQRTTTLAPSRIAGWQFGGDLAGNEDGVTSNGNRRTTNSVAASVVESRLASTVSCPQGEVAQPTPLRRTIRSVRWIPEVATDD